MALQADREGGTGGGTAGAPESRKEAQRTLRFSFKVLDLYKAEEGRE